MTVDPTESWTKLEERRKFGAPSIAAVADQFKAEAKEALAEGYLPEDIAWSGGNGWHVLEVTFVYDPKRARPE